MGTVSDVNHGVVRPSTRPSGKVTLFILVLPLLPVWPTTPVRTNGFLRAPMRGSRFVGRLVPLQLRKDGRTMASYDISAIEKKWQDRWELAGTSRVSKDSDRPKFYNLQMYPYPSGELHM